MRVCGLLMALMVWMLPCGGAAAQDRLYPGSGPMHEYTNALRQVFSHAYRFNDMESAEALNLHCQPIRMLRRSP